MEEYTNNSNHIRENTGPVRGPSPRENFLYTTAVSGSSGGKHHHQFPISNFHLHQSSGSGQSFQPDQVPHNPNVKTESNNTTSQQLHFHYPLLRGNLLHPHLTQHGGSQSSNEVEEDIKAKIIAHPQYSNLLQVYMDCQKVGAPPEVVARMAAAQQEFEARQRSSVSSKLEASKDPELDQFMEAYYDMLVKYRDELTRPVQEAMDFMRRIENQLNMLCNGNGPMRIFSDDKREGVGSSEEDQDNSGGETELSEIDPRAEDSELKNHLLRKYSGYLSNLKQELSKKKKIRKLPKDARQKLLSWWELHYKWPYPSQTTEKIKMIRESYYDKRRTPLSFEEGNHVFMRVVPTTDIGRVLKSRKLTPRFIGPYQILKKESEKLALAESTGLDQKQINNWFINQRKRHWKPSEDMQFMVMDGLHPQNAADFMADGHYRLGP